VGSSLHASDTVLLLSGFPMSNNWTTTSQTTQSEGVKICVYGPAGVGKTVMCATAPDPIIISAESGLLSLRRANIERVYGVGTPGITYDIPVYEINSAKGFWEIYNYLIRDPNARQRFKTVCLDSASELAERILEEALKNSGKDPRQAYGVVANDMPPIFKALRDLSGYHVYVTSKMGPIKDGVSGVVKWGPSMPGNKIELDLPYVFSEFFRVGLTPPANGVSYRFLQTQPDMQHDAKDRSGALNPVEEPNLSKVIAKILGD
jgi:hypothetical protein